MKKRGKSIVGYEKKLDEIKVAVDQINQAYIAPKIDKARNVQTDFRDTLKEKKSVFVSWYSKALKDLSNKEEVNRFKALIEAAKEHAKRIVYLPLRHVFKSIIVPFFVHITDLVFRGVKKVSAQIVELISAHLERLKELSVNLIRFGILSIIGGLFVRLFVLAQIGLLNTAFNGSDFAVPAIIILIFEAVPPIVILTCAALGFGFYLNGLKKQGEYIFANVDYISTKLAKFLYAISIGQIFGYLEKKRLEKERIEKKKAEIIQMIEEAVKPSKT